MTEVKRLRLLALLSKGLVIDELTELTNLLLEERNEWHKTKVKNLGLFDVSKRSCDKSCSQSDWYEGGKCDKNGCYYK
jgi:hypothetical protein